MKILNAQSDFWGTRRIFAFEPGSGQGAQGVSPKKAETEVPQVAEKPEAFLPAEQISKFLSEMVAGVTAITGSEDPKYGPLIKAAMEHENAFESLSVALRDHADAALKEGISSEAILRNTQGVAFLDNLTEMSGDSAEAFDSLKTDLRFI